MAPLSAPKPHPFRATYPSWPTRCASRASAAPSRRASRPPKSPGGSSTTKELAPGKVWFCQFGAVPSGQGRRWKGMSARRAKRRPAGALWPQARTKAPGPAVLVEPDRDPRSDRPHQVRRQPRFRLREGTRPGVLRVPGPADRPPGGGEIAVEVDPAAVEAGAGGAPVGVEVGDDDEVGAGVGAAAAEDEAGLQPAGGALVAVDAAEDQQRRPRRVAPLLDARSCAPPASARRRRPGPSGCRGGPA